MARKASMPAPIQLAELPGMTGAWGSCALLCGAKLHSDIKQHVKSRYMERVKKVMVVTMVLLIGRLWFRSQILMYVAKISHRNASRKQAKIRLPGI